MTIVEENRLFVLLMFLMVLLSAARIVRETWQIRTNRSRPGLVVVTFR